MKNILMVLIYLFTSYDAFKTYDGVFQPCNPTETVLNFNSVFGTVSTDYKKRSMLEIRNLLDKNVLDFFKIITTKSQRNVYYVNNGIMYKTNCNEVVEKITVKNKEVESVFCSKYISIAYSDNLIGFLDTNGIIRSKETKVSCNDVVGQEYFDLKGSYLFTRNKDEILDESK